MTAEMIMTASQSLSNDQMIMTGTNGYSLKPV